MGSNQQGNVHELQEQLSVDSRITNTEIFFFFHPALPYIVYSSNFCYLYASFLEGLVKTI